MAMLTLNKVMIIGNVGTEPEMRFTPNGNPVTSFRVATNRVYTTPEGERRQETEWFTVVAWNRLAENCNQYLTKGQRVYAEGRLHTRSWEGQDGQQRSRSEIVANRVLFLDRQAMAPVSGEGGEEAGPSEPEPTVEDVPFPDEG
ncbi:MAG: single-stranded DNA-binding protein [Chloroflexi bacterium]|jgi:single-strand DNA-binding protein|nr:single-stranded DNA-binding protein [Chloroflexota bacterium]